MSSRYLARAGILVITMIITAALIATLVDMQVFDAGTHRGSEFDWLIGYPNVFAACFFFYPGVWLLVVENANTDIEMRRHNWEAQGRQGKKPGCRFITLMFALHYILLM